MLTGIRWGGSMSSTLSEAKRTGKEEELGEGGTRNGYNTWNVNKIISFKKKFYRYTLFIPFLPLLFIPLPTSMSPPTLPQIDLVFFNY
jgi:hypothetical protein